MYEKFHYKSFREEIERCMAEDVYYKMCTVRAPVFGRHQFFGTSEHYGKAHGSLLSG